MRLVLLCTGVGQKLKGKDGGRRVVYEIALEPPPELPLLAPLDGATDPVSGRIVLSTEDEHTAAAYRVGQTYEVTIFGNGG